MEDKKLIGAGIFAWLIILVGIWSLLVGLVESLEGFGTYGGRLRWGIILALTYSITCFVIGRGLLKRKNWARFLTIFIAASFLCIVSLRGIVSTYKFINSAKGILPRSFFINYFFSIAYLLFSISLIFYLTRPKVKEQFNGPGPQEKD